MSRATATKVAVFSNFFEKSNGYFSKKYPLKFSKLKNQGPLILNEAMPDLMVAFLGWSSNFKKLAQKAYRYAYFNINIIFRPEKKSVSSLRE